MKNKVMKLIDNAIGGAEDNLYRAKMQFGKMDDKALDSEYGQSGRTCREIYQAYIDDKVEKVAMKEWLNSAT